MFDRTLQISKVNWDLFQESGHISYLNTFEFTTLYQFSKVIRTQYSCESNLGFPYWPLSTYVNLLSYRIDYWLGDVTALQSDLDFTVHQLMLLR